MHVCKLGGDDIICTLEICEEVCLSKYKKVILPHGGGLPKKKKKKHPEGYWEKNLYVIGVKLLHVSYEYNNKVLLIIT